MKKTAFILLIVLSGNYSFSQTQKGAIALGASVSFSSNTSSVKAGNTSTDGPESSNLGINASLAFFIADKVAIGPIVGFASTSSEQTTYDFTGNPITAKNKLTGPDLGLLFRYYFAGNESLSFFGGASADYKFLSGESTVTVSNTSTDIKENTLHTGLNGGIVFFPSKKIGIEASIGFLGINNIENVTGSGNDEVSVKNNQFQFDLFKAPLQFALVWYFGSK